MKHSPFSSILFLSGALVFLLPAFDTKSLTGEPGASRTAGNEISVTLPDAGSFSCSLPAPGSFDGERTSETTAYLSWSAVSGAVAYRLKIYNLDTNELISNTLEYSTSKNISGLATGVAYRCVLASVCLGGATSDFVIIVDAL